MAGLGSFRFGAGCDARGDYFGGVTPSPDGSFGPVRWEGVSFMYLFHSSCERLRFAMLQSFFAQDSGSMSHRQTVPSAPAETSPFPSGRNANKLGGASGWPFSGSPSALRLATSHSLTGPLLLPQGHPVPPVRET